MSETNLRRVTARVVERAKQQGQVVAREVREELSQAGLSEDLWKDVLALARDSLTYRRGRYHYSAPVSERVRAEQSHLAEVREAVGVVIREHLAATTRVERRAEGRVDYVQPVKVITEDGREFTLLTRDLSLTGIRLVGTRRLLGQKVRVRMGGAGKAPLEFQVRVLWTCPVGDDLVENGGTFMGVSRVEG